MEIAITPDSIYMLSDFSGASMGMLVKDETVYMVYPEKKIGIVCMPINEKGVLYFSAA